MWLRGYTYFVIFVLGPPYGSDFKNFWRSLSELCMVTHLHKQTLAFVYNRKAVHLVMVPRSRPKTKEDSEFEVAAP